MRVERDVIRNNVADGRRMSSGEGSWAREMRKELMAE